MAVCCSIASSENCCRPESVLLLAGRGYLEVLHQVMLAVATASDMEVAGLIENRSPGGLLPHPTPDADDPNDPNDPQTSTLTLPTLLQLRTGALTEPASTHAGDTPADGQRLNSEQPHRAVSVQLHASSGAAAQQAQLDRPAEHALQHVDKQEGNPESDIAKQYAEEVAGPSGTLPDQDMGQPAEAEARPCGALPDQDMAQPAEEEAGPSGASPDQDMPQPTREEARPSRALPDQAMTQHEEEEAGPSSLGWHAQTAAAVPQQRKRKFDTGPDPLVSLCSGIIHLHVNISQR